MKPTTKSILTFTAVVFASTLCPTAANAETNFCGGLHFNAGFFQGDLKDQIDRNAYGIGGQILYSPQRSPLALGLELGWLNYGSESRREPFSTTIPDVTVDVETSNNIVQAFLVMRGRMHGGPIQLYGDAIIGLNYLFTETEIKDNSLENVASSTNSDDVAFAYGFGGGLMVPIYTRDESSGNKPFQVLIDGGVRYVFGGEAEYLKKGSIRRENGTVTYDPTTSRTDMMRLHAGVVVRF